jgi:uncharacterized protein
MANPAPGAAVAETHSGVVFFIGDRAYKMKKAVDLGFLDFTSLEARREACAREVALNRRLAPDVYLGVGAILDVDGQPCEHLVVMRRLPTERRLSSLAADGADLRDAVTVVAQLMARFHRATPVPDRAAKVAAPDELLRRWDDLVERIERTWGGNGGAADPVLRTVHHLARRYVEDRRLLFEERVAAGRARDGHGDLLADDIFLLDDGPRILDCLDFDESLRCGDVLADVAFLAMDLERLGRQDLADLLLLAYRDASGDDWPPSLAHFYLAERAAVRWLAASLRVSQGDARSEEQVGVLRQLAAHHLRAAQVLLVAVGGTPGTGKSTLARALAVRLGADLLRSDEVRRHAPVSPCDRYDRAATEWTYAELLRRASDRLARGRGVVLDATWSDPRWRDELAALARSANAEPFAFETRVDPATADRRIRARLLRNDDVSEATPEVAGRIRSTWVPWPEAIAIDTAAPPGAAAEAAYRALASALDEEEQG